MSAGTLCRADPADRSRGCRALGRPDGAEPSKRGCAVRYGWLLCGDRARQRPHAGHAQRQGFYVIWRAAIQPVGRISGRPVSRKEVSDFSDHWPTSDLYFKTRIWRDGARNDGPFRVNQGFSLWAISLLGRAATSPRPDLFFARLLRAAAVKGGQRPSRRDLPLAAASTAADLRDRGASFPVQCQQLRYRGETRHRARRLRATNLYSADL